MPGDRPATTRRPTHPICPALFRSRCSAGCPTKHAGGPHRYLARRVGTTSADDLVSETFLAAPRGRHGNETARAAVRPWLYGIVSNRRRRHVRDELRELPRPDWSIRASWRPRRAGSPTAWTGTPGSRLAGALARLSDADREVLMTSWAGLSPVEIG